MYDAASTILEQKLSQIQGVGQVSVGGGALPSVRVEVNPSLLNSFGLSLRAHSQLVHSANNADRHLQAQRPASPATSAMQAGWQASLINSSALRREAIPAAAIIFCRRSAGICAKLPSFQ